MLRSKRFVGTINGKRYWKAIICGHPVTGYVTERCWDCWKPEQGRFQRGRKHKVTHYGPKHHSWRGGKAKTHDGYTLIKIRHHPNAQSNGYILEHRWVMEQHIGRPLLKEEVVHHINHDRSDNRIENLMLFGSHSEHIKYEYSEGARSR